MPALPEPPVLEPKHSATEQRLVLYNVPWDDYEQFCELFAGHNVRLAYQQGTLEIMPPSMGHEFSSYASGRAIDVLAEEMDVIILPGRSVTLKSEAVERGIEADNCYWIANEELVRAKEEIDLDVDPPPDLFVEVEVTRTVLDRLDICSKLGIPEVWRIEGGEIKILIRDADGAYSETDESSSFPGFPVKEIAPFLKRKTGVDYLTHMRQFRDWVRGRLDSNSDSPN